MIDQRFHRRTGPYTAKEIAEAIGAELVRLSGDEILLDVAPLQDATNDMLAFLDNRKYLPQVAATKARACIIHPDLVARAPDNLGLMVTKKPYRAYALAAQKFYPVRSTIEKTEISPRAVVSESAEIGPCCIIEAGVVIGENVKIGKATRISANTVIGDSVVIGENCVIYPNCTISHTVIGDFVTLYAGVSIGQPGFGYAMEPTGHIVVPQLGRVLIEDHVEIGANSTIDRGAGPDTIIGQGTIIDNLVQIGHNVKIGKGCVIVSQTGISGSTILEDFVVTAGQTGIAGHLRIGMGAQIAAKSGIMNDVPAGEKYMGYPAVPIRQYMRQTVCLQKMAEASRNKTKK